MWLPVLPVPVIVYVYIKINTNVFEKDTKTFSMKIFIIYEWTKK